MPHEVRMVHLLETASSNFLFGWLVVVVLGWRIRSQARVTPSTDTAKLAAKTELKYDESDNAQQQSKTGTSLDL